MSRTGRYEYQDWKGFGSRIQKYRKQVGLTKEKFAEKINRSENYVADLEKGRTSGSVHTLHQISKALKVSTDVLLYGENMNNNENYTNREILENIISRCNEEEAEILKDIIVATFPNLNTIREIRKADKKQ